MKTKRIGNCSRCGWVALDLKADGTVHAHGSAQTGYPRKTCPGNGKAPAAGSVMVYDEAAGKYVDEVMS